MKGKEMEEIKVQTDLEALYLAKDNKEVWHTLCRTCADEFATSNGLKWNTYKFMPRTAETPNGVARPEGEEFEPIVFEPEIFESDIPQACENCDLWLEVYLLDGAKDYMEEHEFAEYVFKLYFDEN
jgi:hypothetical protein